MKPTIQLYMMHSINYYHSKTGIVKFVFEAVILMHNTHDLDHDIAQDKIELYLLYPLTDLPHHPL